MASDSHAKRPIVVERRKEKGRKKTPRLTKTYDVKIIPATVGVVAETEEPPKKRVAAYCRVSTDQEAQETSLEEQMAHFNTVIAEHPDWELAGIYADEGISGTQVKHRVQFQQMIEDAKAKKIDLILTKSISRFARNVVDCLTNIRLLRNLRPPVSVYFDKERLDSLDEKAEVFLTMLASFAQEESRSISTNIKWATRSRMKAGTQKISTTSLLGYDTDDDGDMVIVTNEAEIVRTIYMSFDKGMHPAEIAEKLNALEIRTIKNNPWTGESVKNILRNEKYCGDVLMQKTYTVDCLTHKTKKNEGEVEQYFIPDHHPAIVEREIWDKAQVRLEQIAGKRRRIRPKQQRLIPLRKGVLLGFVPIRPTWKAVSFKRLETATEKVMALVDAKPEQVHIEYESEECEMEILKGFEVNEVRAKEGSNIKGFATVVFGDSFKITNIAILENKDKGELFVSMPRYRSNERDESNGVIYKDVCNPITAEFREELYTNILDAYARIKEPEKEETQKQERTQEMPEFSVTVTPYEREGSNIKGLARIYFENSFIVNNINIVQGKEKIFVSMPSYKTKQVDEQGKPIYQDVCYPVTKDFREKLYNEIISEYEKAKDKSNENARESAEKHHGNPDKEKDKEATPFR